MMRTLNILAGLLLGCALVGGCSSGQGGATSFTVPAGRYAECFDAARDALGEKNYRLNRVDASVGVITTHPASYVGALTPWNAQRASAYEAIEETLNQHARVATVRFTPAAPPGPLSGDPTRQPSRDLRGYAGELLVEVVVSVERASIPGTRVDSGAVGLSTVTSNPLPNARHLWPRYNVAVRIDESDAGEIVRAIRSRLGVGPSDP